MAEEKRKKAQRGGQICSQLLPPTRWYPRFRSQSGERRSMSRPRLRVPAHRPLLRTGPVCLARVSSAWWWPQYQALRTLQVLRRCSLPPAGDHDQASGRCLGARMTPASALWPQNAKPSGGFASPGVLFWSCDADEKPCCYQEGGRELASLRGARQSADD